MKFEDESSKDVAVETHIMKENEIVLAGSKVDEFPDITGKTPREDTGREIKNPMDT